MGLILFDILDEEPYSRVFITYLTAEDLEWYLMELQMEEYFEEALSGLIQLN